MPIETNFYKHNQDHFLFLFQMDQFSAKQGVVSVSQRLVLLLLEESSPCLPLRTSRMGFSAEPPPTSKSSNIVGEKVVSMPVEQQHLHPANHFSSRLEHRPDQQQTPDNRLCPSLFLQLRLKVFCPSFHVFPPG